MKAEKLAKKLASDCYMSAVKFFSSLLVIVFATCFLIYYTFKNGTPQNLSGLMVFAFFSGAMFLLLGFVGSLYRMKRFSKHSILTFFLRDQIDNGTAANGKRRRAQRSIRQPPT